MPVLGFFGCLKKKPGENILDCFIYHLISYLLMTDKTHSDEPYWLQVVRQIVRKHKHEADNKVDVKPATNNKDAKFCFECGKKINRDAKFCVHCGAKQPVI